MPEVVPFERLKQISLEVRAEIRRLEKKAMKQHQSNYNSMSLRQLMLNSLSNEDKARYQLLQKRLKNLLNLLEKAHLEES